MSTDSHDDPLATTHLPWLTKPGVQGSRRNDGDPLLRIQPSKLSGCNLE